MIRARPVIAKKKLHEGRKGERIMDSGIAITLIICGTILALVIINKFKSK